MKIQGKIPVLNYSKRERKKERKKVGSQETSENIDEPRNMLKKSSQSAICEITCSIPSNYLVLSLYENNRLSWPTPWGPFLMP